MTEPKSFTTEEIKARPPDMSYDEVDDEAALGPNEHEGPSVGKARASHAAPEKVSVGKPAAKDPAAPKAASTGASLPENADDDAVYPTHTKGQVQKYRCAMDEGTNGKEVEHVVVDQHPFELITRTCWEMEGAEKLRFPQRLWEHRAKVNAVTRGQPGQDTSLFDDEMWLGLDDFSKLFNRMLPKKIARPNVEELLAVLHHDNKCRFEFRRVASLQLATRKGLAYWPFKIRAVQGHNQKAITRASASDTFNATMIYANSGGAALAKIPSTGKPIVTADETPGVIYHRTTKSNWKGIIKGGFNPGGGDKVSSGRAHSYFSEVRVAEGSYVSGLRADRPIEIRVAVAEAVKAGVIFIKTASEGILTQDVVPAHRAQGQPLQASSGDHPNCEDQRSWQ